MRLDCENLNYKKLNDLIKETDENVIIENCFGQRFIGAGLENRELIINGVPGNGLGCYLNGGVIQVNGNVQDAVGDTMNDGKIIVDGNAGEALGYAMRGGKIFIRGNAGYRTGIHMKEYQGKKPIIVVGGSAGSFLGEYLAGGIIIVLGLNKSGALVGNFTGTGMHGGSIFIRTGENNASQNESLPPEIQNLPKQVSAQKASAEDMEEIKPLLAEYADDFEVDFESIFTGIFYKLSPNAKNPYKQLYTAN